MVSLDAAELRVEAPAAYTANGSSDGGAKKAANGMPAAAADGGALPDVVAVPISAEASSAAERLRCVGVGLMVVPVGSAELLVGRPTLQACCHC